MRFTEFRGANLSIIIWTFYQSIIAFLRKKRIFAKQQINGTKWYANSLWRQPHRHRQQGGGRTGAGRPHWWPNAHRLGEGVDQGEIWQARQRVSGCDPPHWPPDLRPGGHGQDQQGAVTHERAVPQGWGPQDLLGRGGKPTAQTGRHPDPLPQECGEQQ